MAGTLITVLPKTTFDFGGISTGTFPLTQIVGPIDVTAYTSLICLVRVHAISIAVNNVITLMVSDDGFVDGSDNGYFSQFGVAVQTMGSSTTAPTLLVQQGQLTGQYVSLCIAAQRAAAGALMATISVELCMRSPDDLSNPEQANDCCSDD